MKYGSFVSYGAATQGNRTKNLRHDREYGSFVSYGRGNRHGGMSKSPCIPFIVEYRGVWK